jgi:hypothetical protein
VLLRTGVDIINYDAFNFMETLFYFRGELSAFLARGGRVAPGIVPSSGEALHEVSLADLARLWRSYEVLLSEVGDALEQATVVTTACGLGTLDEADAYRGLELLKRLPEAVDAAEREGRG